MKKIVEQQMYPVTSTKTLKEWGCDEFIAESVNSAIKEKKNILIVGDLASGKTKMMNELISLSNPNMKYQFFYNSRGNENLLEQGYIVEERNRSRLIDSVDTLSQPCNINESVDFVVIDDVFREELVTIIKQLHDNKKEGTIATAFLRSESDLELIAIHLKKHFDLMIYLNGYKNTQSITFLK
ncbi:hypothetical protein AWH56_008545 [Anaerobacillus isosaccharinicus]|uniref:Bacterial type II secretion system protein E domain-containing protein n=1 Tax=Anaerobacillus isosaccharinicus TaxID=1532552 RepID=A0A1S2L186_9BACI|nr:hypothetical protein [Anaerobacillus isosaccharinicus]MBA5583967.1 hypothetical protein [Anaerobacillus isosaccharinicus]QOY37615.1 hypothetical protein AWH56_008545 [Anaerobacillus isosaccharinicus]